jgi:putative FmdB family regulatory protein
MPFYEYQCQACGSQVEVLQKISEPPLRKCPECGKSKLTKLVSAPVFRLKGGGWYETDFKSDKDVKRNLAGAEKDAPAAGGETKPAADAAAATPAKDAKPAADKPADKPAEKSAEKPVASRSASKTAAKPVAKGRPVRAQSKPASSKRRK